MLHNTTIHYNVHFVILQISNTDGADIAAIAGGMVDAEVRIYIFTLRSDKWKSESVRQS